MEKSDLLWHFSLKGKKMDVWAQVYVCVCVCVYMCVCVCVLSGSAMILRLACCFWCTNEKKMLMYEDRTPLLYWYAFLQQHAAVVVTLTSFICLVYAHMPCDSFHM